MERHLNTADNRMRNVTATGIFLCGVEACLFILLQPNLIKKKKYEEYIGIRNTKFKIVISGRDREGNSAEIREGPKGA